MVHPAYGRDSFFAQHAMICAVENNIKIYEGENSMENERCPKCGCELLWFLPNKPCSNVACDPIWGHVEINQTDKDEDPED